MIVKILIAVLIFGITVIIHELGHFLLAKANGITVTEFSIGFGPTVVKTEKGGTVYSLKLLPFGGACQMLGEDGEEEGEGTFNSKSVWARISVVAAGPVFNMILAFFCAIFVISYAGSSPARVTEVADGSPEAEAGLEAGDIITSYEGRHISIGKELNSVMTVQGVPTDEITLEVKKADGEKKTITYEPTVTTRYMMGFNYDDCDRGMEFTYVQQNMPLAAAGVVAGDLLVSINGAPITCVADFTAYQTEHPFDGSAVTLEYEHSGKTKEITVTPVENTYANVQFSYQLREKQSPIGVLKYSVLEIKYWVRTVIDSVSMLITGQYSVNDLSGPVGVVDAIDVGRQADIEPGREVLGDARHRRHAAMAGRAVGRGDAVGAEGPFEPWGGDAGVLPGLDLGTKPVGAGGDELGAVVEDRVADPTGRHPSADPSALVDHDDVGARLDQRTRRRQAGDTGAHDHNDGPTDHVVRPRIAGRTWRPTSSHSSRWG